MKYSWISFISVPNQFYVSSSNWYGDRGVLGGNESGTRTYIEYITITTPSNSTNFGELTMGRGSAGAVSNGTRGVFMRGVIQLAYTNVMDYVTISTIGNAVDFGDSINNNRSNSTATASNGIRGTQSGGYPSNNIIEYITISILSNTYNFGTLSVTRQWSTGCSGRIRGIVAGGYKTNIIDYFTISILSDAVDFGDLTVARYYLASCGNETKCVFAGGSTQIKTIDYININTLGNATSFGNLITGRYRICGCGNNTRAIICNAILDYIEFETKGNSVSFGNPINISDGPGACSGN